MIKLISENISGVFVLDVKPKLLFTTRHSINMFTLASDINAQPVLVQNSGASTVDFDYMAEEVFYSDFDMKELAKFSLLSADQADVVNQVRKTLS